MPLRFRILAASAAIPRSAAPAGAGGEIAQGPGAERVFELGGSEGGGGGAAADELAEVGIGRQAGSEIQLPFPSVSARHARLFRGELPGDWWVEDLGSTNGSWLDGARLENGRPQPLRAGQRLRVATVD